VNRSWLLIPVLLAASCSILDRQKEPEILAFETVVEADASSVGRARRVVIRLLTDDPDNDELDYHLTATGGQFEKTGRDTVIDLFQDSVSVTWIAPTEVGVYVLNVEVSDRKSGEVIASTLSILVTQGAPLAAAGGDRVLGYSDTLNVALDGTGSIDPDRDALRYIWVQIGGPSVVLQPQDSASPVFPAVAPADYVFVLTVSDERAAADGAITSDPDTVVIRISDRSGRGQTASP